jgi:hypothetical protein
VCRGRHSSDCGGRCDDHDLHMFGALCEAHCSQQAHTGDCCCCDGGAFYWRCVWSLAVSADPLHLPFTGSLLRHASLQNLTVNMNIATRSLTRVTNLRDFAVLFNPFSTPLPSLNAKQMYASMLCLLALLCHCEKGCTLSTRFEWIRVKCHETCS